MYWPPGSGRFARVAVRRRRWTFTVSQDARIVTKTHTVLLLCSTAVPPSRSERQNRRQVDDPKRPTTTGPGHYTMTQQQQYTYVIILYPHNPTSSPRRRRRRRAAVNDDNIDNNQTRPRIRRDLNITVRSPTLRHCVVILLIFKSIIIIFNWDIFYYLRYLLFSFGFLLSMTAGRPDGV